MIETREKVINGSTYSATQLPARRALKLQYKLIKIFGSAISQVLLPSLSDDKGKVEGSTISLGIDKRGISSAIMSITSQMDDACFESLIKELVQGVRKEGRELTDSFIDTEFAGDLSTLWKVIWFVLEINFDNFFEDLGFGSLFNESESNPE